MAKIKIVNGDLFSAEKGSLLVHSCNCQGMWASGIAKQFAERFPEAYLVYQEACKRPVKGTALLIPDKEYTIGCLFTSFDYGAFKDSWQEILVSTRTAVKDLIEKNVLGLPIAMCKINAGLFAVPWEETQRVLEEFDQEMTVYEF